MCVQVIGGGAVLVNLSPKLAMVTAVVAMIYLALANFYGRYTRKLAKTVQDAIASTNQVAEETLSRAAVVRVFGAEGREVTPLTYPYLALERERERESERDERERTTLTLP